MARIPFYIPEITFLDANDPRQPGAHLSYAQIAAELNRQWPHYNEGKRSRGTVILYYNRKRQRSGLQVRVVALPKEVSDQLTADDIRRIIVSHCVAAGEKRA